ncbi:FliI/YscN family ATPase [Robbsia sp. Bb-Pol-6]|uniref:FliI/YscN family ATPase n=1 Tax=Robbsia betulipollinis TaxID=2981849 RepID=A0ABT3ZV28_9BURK|nr:FliI/YscN family ATPase [Robbsia betulipollinis]MCY0389750.1 FliI/YscN family ATPase [Robbsia betulipollinis]
MPVTDAWVAELAHTLGAPRMPRLSGRVASVVGGALRASLPGAAIGDLCEVRSPDGGRCGRAEVVAIDGQGATLLPYGELAGLTRGHEVVRIASGAQVEVGDHLLGGVVDGAGQWLNAPAQRTVPQAARAPLMRSAPDPLTRHPVARAMGSGVRAIDGLLTLGEGQRVGIFAAAGMGKTSLLGMLLRGAAADVCVIGLIGERGREVGEFLEFELSERARARTTVVVATAERPAVERRRAAYLATALAEYHRARGRSVLLIMDSLTRFARAAREIGLAAGEPPTRRGYPPSVFSALPRLLERAGNDDRGSITAIYTVLVEGDDLNEPVADEARSLLDGHIVLSAKLANAGQYPAIDVLRSVSRVMHRVTEPPHRADAARLRALLAKHQDIELLVSLGEYRRGHDALGDEALDRIAAIRAYLAQPLDAVTEMAQAHRELAALWQHPQHPPQS